MRRRPRPDEEAGMVTAETAVVLPVLLLVLAAAVAAVTVVGAQLRCVDAAREGARAAARGETFAVVKRVTAQTAPPGAVTGVLDAGDEVRVVVSAEIALFGLFLLCVVVCVSVVAWCVSG